jgi:hypothetical protein
MIPPKDSTTAFLEPRHADEAEELVERAHALCVDRAGLAALLKVSPRQILRLDSAGKIPAALEFGRCKRWNVEEIRDWLRAGGPPRRRWQAMRGVEK